MSERPPFNPDDAFDAIADLARQAVGNALVEVVQHERYQGADAHEAFNAVTVGLMVGCLGGLQAMIETDSHPELRAAIKGNLDFCFDQAREIVGLPPLGEGN